MKYDVEAVQAAALKYSQNLWWEEARKKPKLRTYVDFTGIEDPRTLVKSNLPRGQWSLLAKLMCGILPLEVEVGRFVGTDKKERFCTVCKTLNIEDEYHFLYVCSPLEEVRTKFYNNHIPDKEGLKNGLMLKKQFFL